jgi:hypothetical protein
MILSRFAAASARAPEVAPQCIASPYSAPATNARFDPRIPVAGTVLTRKFRDRTVVVKVLKNGFEYQGRRYGSLSAIWMGACFHADVMRNNGSLRLEADSCHDSF